jgi:hypothetical protein
MTCATPRLDSALEQLATTLRRIDADITTLAPSAPLESKLRASVFHMRIQNTLRELERPQCQH